jgi:hypothetical protein
MKTNRNLLVVLVLIAAFLSAAWAVHRSVNAASTRGVFYKVVHKDSINTASADLYMKSLTPHGGGGWELVLIDGDYYVFKQVK